MVMNEYDFLIVGAGISSAAFCAALKNKYNICVIDTRPHIGGNCYDYKVNDTFVQLYGPHFFHTSNKKIYDFLSKYTEWISYSHSVTAEIKDNEVIKRVPFPYSKQTELCLGRYLSEDERIDLFFKPYSKKMWNRNWEDLPNLIKNRIPKDTKETSCYFPDQISVLPKNGYTKMIENMFVGVDLILGANENDWKEIKSKNIIYCGRPDKLIWSELLEWRNLKFTQKVENWDANTPVVNFCHMDTIYNRKTSQGKIWNSKSNLVIYEESTDCNVNDISPYYPFVDEENQEKYKNIQKQIKYKYPNLYLMGRLGTYKYMDMDAAIGQALNLSERF